MNIKTFYDLTEEQQEAAILFSKSILLESIDFGLIETDGPFLEEEIYKLAVMAAEGAVYDSQGKAILNLPYN